MATCGVCGADSFAPQCPRCGAVVEERQPLELAGEQPLELAGEQPLELAGEQPLELAGEQPLELADAPARGAPPAGHGAKRIEPRTPPTPSASFAERTRKDRAMLWRVTRVPVLLLLGWFTLSHAVLGAKWVFVDNVNLLLHEAGHVLFGWGGETLAALGGTLGQLMWPAVFATYFWRWRRERFAAIACVWWFGENLPVVGRYMADAPFEHLPLVGGDQHDWAFLFRRWDLLSSAQEIGSAVRFLGIAAMIASLAILTYFTVRPTERELEY